MYNCPECRKPLKCVPQSEWMNADQWNAVKAGDYFCTSCPSNGRSDSGLCYWWQWEIEFFETELCNQIMRS